VADIEPIYYIAAGIQSVLFLLYVVIRKSRALTVLTVVLSFLVAETAVVFGWTQANLWPLAMAIVVAALWWVVLARLHTHPRRMALLTAVVLLLLGIGFRAWDEPRPAPHRDSTDSTFALSVDSPGQFEGLRFVRPPTVELSSIMVGRPGTAWLGTFSLIVEGPSSLRNRRTLRFLLMLPRNLLATNGEMVIAPYPDKAPEAMATRVTPTGVLVLCSVTVGKSEAKEFEIRFAWLPPSHRLRLGEQRVLFARGSAEWLGLGQPFPTGPNALAPQLRMITDSSRVDLQAYPTPAYSLRDVALWDLTPPNSQLFQELDVTLSDHRIRAIADPAVELIVLAVGLILGLITERAVRPVGLQAVRETQEQLNARAHDLQLRIEASEATMAEMRSRWSDFAKTTLRKGFGAGVLVALLILFRRRHR
jgi:hypothetical protein